MISDKCRSNGHTSYNNQGINVAKEDRVTIIADDTDIFVLLCHYLKGTAAEYKDI